jgi:hypothetical protein
VSGKIDVGRLVPTPVGSASIGGNAHRGTEKKRSFATNRNVGKTAGNDKEHLLCGIVDVARCDPEPPERSPGEVVLLGDDVAQPDLAVGCCVLHATRDERPRRVLKGVRLVVHLHSMAEKLGSDQCGRITPNESSQPKRGGSVMVTGGRSKM